MNIEKVQGDAGSASAAGPTDGPMAGGAMTSNQLPRRRFVKGAIGASGVLLTLASQPGMAVDICRSPSGSLSGGLQSHGPVVACAGRLPDYYKTHSGWPSPCTESTLFASVFACSGMNRDTYGQAGTTFGLLLSPQSFDSGNIGMHLVATYLNILSGRIGFLTDTQVLAIWNDWQIYGYYSPTAGVQWDASQIVTYLAGTMS